MEVHLVDGTYELFRHFHGQPSRKASDGREIAAVRGVLLTVLKMLSDTTTHIGVATDHVVESFRNELWPGYKDGSGNPPELLAQFELLEEALMALGVVVWPMVDVEADDALPPQPRSPTAPVALSGSSSAPRTRIWRSASSVNAWSSSIGGAARFATRPGWSRNSASRLRRFRTGLPWSATPRTGSLDLRAGAPVPPRSCSRTTARSMPYPMPLRSGIPHFERRSPGSEGSPRRWLTVATRRRCSACLQPCVGDLPLFDDVDTDPLASALPNRW